MHQAGFLKKHKFIVSDPDWIRMQMVLADPDPGRPKLSKTDKKK
jgi:hypothetical protein